MSRRDGARWIVQLAVLAVPLGVGLQCKPSEPSDEAARPNFLPNLVIIYIDDAGYADTGPTGAEFRTPNLDQLAEQGTLYTSFHVAQSVCTPSRAALLTGVYPNRIGMIQALFPGDGVGLHPDEQTLGELAQERGYRTGAFGKWHLGDAEPFLPPNQGFDEFAGIPYSNDMWPLESSEFPPLPFLEGTTVKNPDLKPDDQRALTADLTRYAVDFIQHHREQPFFLYLAHPQPHVPLHVSKQFEGASGEGLFADVMMEIDWSVGEVVRAIDEAQLGDKTWIVFASDNGPWLTYGNHAGSARPFREGKFTTFEGGTRVPLIMRFPGFIPAGATNSATFMNIDLLPTFAGVSGAQLPAASIDGRDIWETLVSGKQSPQPAYYLWNADSLEAVLLDEWKLHLPHAYQTVTVPGADGERGTTELAELPLSLFDLGQDPGETLNVASEHPELVAQLRELAEAHAAEVMANRRGPGQL